MVGGIIDLGRCLNLLDADGLAIARTGYAWLKELCSRTGAPLPVNKSVGASGELLLRHLDCAVIEAVHEMRAERNLEPFDTVRGVFVEGNALYPGAGFHARNHIQICVRNPRLIKGYFRVLDDASMSGWME